MRFKYLFGLLVAIHLQAGAQSSFPNKPLTIVVPYSAGGVTDSLARALSQRLTVAFKQQVLVDNRAGGNSIIGAQAVAKAAPDGYTLLLTAEATLAMNPHLYPKLPYNAEKSFAPVITVAQAPQSLAVANDVPAQSLDKFIAYAKANPSKLSYATLGTGSTPHLNFELFQRAAGIKLGDVAFKGAAPAITDLVGGHVNAMIISTGLIAPQARAGKVRVLAVGGSSRSPQMPEVPTFTEAGMRGFAPSSWFALLTVAGTPPEIVKRLNMETGKALADPTFKAEFLDKFGLEARGGSPEDLAALIKSESQRWGEVIHDAGIKLE
jgi:tripartite-type tricarboxylate transporter receptor subunit TctC